MYMHMSCDRLYAIPRERYFWDGMYADISEWVNDAHPIAELKQLSQKNIVY